MNILVVNAGSSSLKYQLIDTDTDTLYAKGICERIGAEGALIEHKQIAKGLKVKKESPMKDHADAIVLPDVTTMRVTTPECEATIAVFACTPSTCEGGNSSLTDTCK